MIAFIFTFDGSSVLIASVGLVASSLMAMIVWQIQKHLGKMDKLNDNVIKLDINHASLAEDIKEVKERVGDLEKYLRVSH